MNYSGSIVINKSREVVTQFFTDTDNLKKWQDGFVKKDLQSGEEGKTGAVSKMYYQYGKKDMVLTETITSNQLPHSFEAFYHHKHMDNTMKCKFISINDNKTRYEYEFEYSRISWVIPKLLAILFPGMYRSQGEKWIKQFKKSVENQ